MVTYKFSAKVVIEEDRDYPDESIINWDKTDSEYLGNVNLDLALYKLLEKLYNSFKDDYPELNVSIDDDELMDAFESDPDCDGGEIKVMFKSTSPMPSLASRLKSFSFDYGDSEDIAVDDGFESGWWDVYWNVNVSNFELIETIGEETIKESNELEARSKFHKKHRKGLSPFVKKDAGNVPLNNAIFNSSVAVSEAIESSYEVEKEILDEVRNILSSNKVSYFDLDWTYLKNGEEGVGIKLEDKTNEEKLKKTLTSENYNVRYLGKDRGSYLYFIPYFNKKIEGDMEEKKKPFKLKEDLRDRDAYEFYKENPKEYAEFKYNYLIGEDIDEIEDNIIDVLGYTRDREEKYGNLTTRLYHDGEDEVLQLSYDDDYIIQEVFYRPYGVNESINIKESLNILDRDTYGKFDLINSYNSLKLSEGFKKSLIEKLTVDDSQINKARRISRLFEGIFEPKTISPEEALDKIDDIYNDAYQLSRSLGEQIDQVFIDYGNAPEAGTYIEGISMESWPEIWMIVKGLIVDYIEDHRGGELDGVPYRLIDRLELEEIFPENAGLEESYYPDDLDPDEEAYWDYMADKKAEEEKEEEERFTYLKSKSVMDTDGFYDDYTMWKDESTDEFIFIFGDNDIYTPENSPYDHVEEDETAAYEWFNSYGEDEEWIDSTTEESVSLNESFKGSKQDLVDWIMEHEQAGTDFYNYFNLEEDEYGEITADNITVEDIEDWIYDHSDLARDFERHFNLKSEDEIADSDAAKYNRSDLDESIQWIEDDEDEEIEDDNISKLASVGNRITESTHGLPEDKRRDVEEGVTGVSNRFNVHDGSFIYEDTIIEFDLPHIWVSEKEKPYTLIDEWDMKEE